MYVIIVGPCCITCSRACRWGADPLAVDGDGATAAHLAAGEGQLAALQRLVAHDARVVSATRRVYVWENCFAHVCVVHHSVSLLGVLDSQPDIITHLTHIGAQGESLEDVALRRGQRACVEFLRGLARCDTFGAFYFSHCLRCGAGLSWCRDAGDLRWPIHESAQRGDLDAVKAR